METLFSKDVVFGSGQYFSLLLYCYLYSNMNITKYLCALIGLDWVLVVDVTFVPVSKVTARVEVEDVIAAIRPTTCLVSIMLANNETGIIMVRMLP